jgi:hypothetical protein
VGSTWFGLLGAIVGGAVSLIGTLFTSRLQWRQERARWLEQRERDQLQWGQQRAVDTERWENERRRDEDTRERERDDEHFRWVREQKLKCYMEIIDHLRTASELAADFSGNGEDKQRGYAKEDEMAVVKELRAGYCWLKAMSALCGRAATDSINDLNDELYYTIQALTYEGIRPGKMVRRPKGKSLDEWIASEVIDGMAAQLSEILRTDLGSD